MSLDSRAFDYLAPTPDQMEKMQACREAANQFATVLQSHVQPGPDQTYLLRKLREVAMWANVAITRQPDGAPLA